MSVDLSSTKPGAWTVSPQITAAPNLWRGLIGAWPMWSFSSPVKDISPERNDATLVNMDSTNFVLGPIGYHFRFNGSDEYLDVGDKAVFDGIPAISISAWFNADTIKSSDGDGHGAGGGDTNNTIICKAGSSDDSFGLGLERSDSMGFYIDNGGNETLDLTTSLSTGVWYHVVATYDGSTQKLYLDGVEDASRSAGSGDLISNTNAVQIGAREAVSLFDGAIDNVMVWNRALSAADARLLFAHPFAYISPAGF